MTGADVPERGESYGAEVWARIQPKLEAPEMQPWPRRLAAFFTWPRLATAGALATLLVAAFVAGRYWAAPAPAHRARSRAKRRPRPLPFANASCSSPSASISTDRRWCWPS